MIDHSRIASGAAAVFVTMNRCETARTCLERLAVQTVRPGRVLVIDNASTDGTAAMLRGWSEFHESVDFETLAENLGNAGGMELAMARMFREGADAVWILDDDSWPEPEALERLLASDLAADAVRSCRVVDLKSGALSWPLQVPRGDGWSFLEEHDALPAGDAVRIRRAWLGALIPRTVYERVGRVTGELFLRGEDEDYPRRIEAAGFPVFLVPDSLLHHPPSGPLKHWDIAGYTVVLECSLQGNPLYYRLRNSWWMIRRDRGTLVAAGVAVLFGAALLRWKGDPRSWAGIWWEAFRDAFSGRLGRRR